jgi:hypothetical protein
MKKSKRPIKLNLETLEIRVVPSQGQGFLEPHHVMGADSAITAEFEKPTADNGNHADQQANNGQSDNGRIESAVDMATSALPNVEQHARSDEPNQSDLDQTDKAKKNSDDNITSTSSVTTSSAVESAESHEADSLKSDDAGKSNHSSEKSKSSNDDSTSDLGSSSNNSSGNSQSSLDSGKGSKSDDNSAKNAKGSKSGDSDSSSSSKGSNSQADNDSTSIITTSSQGSGDTIGSSPTKAVHGKSQSDHKDTSGDSNSSDTNVVSGNQPTETSVDGITEAMISVGARQAPAFAEANSGKPAAEAANSGVLGAPLGLDTNTASIASMAAVLSTHEVLVQVPAVVDTAIPLAIPVLQSFAPSLGLGELAAMDTLAPVAGDLIVGFLPVEQMNLASAMQGVLSEIDSLGEQVMGSGAGKWLYPIVFTALAATTVFQLATRRRRQLQRQSVWASESGIWSGSYFGQP